MTYNPNLPLQVWQTIVDSLDDKIDELTGRPDMQRELFEATQARAKLLEELAKQGVIFTE